MVRKIKEEYELSGLLINEKYRKRRCKKCEYLVVGNDTMENLSLQNRVIKRAGRARWGCCSTSLG
jgi:hypothetical protein